MIRSAIVPLFVLACSIPASAQDQSDPPAFAQDQLEQMVGPIALYPDALMTQILMASTYPLEIVEADRWVGSQPTTDPAALDQALKEQGWDASVKSLVAMPDVLKWMSQNLDWVRDLGDALLGQESDLFAAIQRMRKKAYDAGNLQTTPEQRVTVQPDGTIIIESVSPDTVFIPEYSTPVYGGWGYATSWYPYVYPPGAALIRFGAGLAIGWAIWGRCDWHGGNVDIDVNRYNNFNVRTNANVTRLSGDKQEWKHVAAHRKGVDYRQRAVASQYNPGGSRAADDRARGRADAGGARPAAGGAAQRPAGGEARGGFSGATQPGMDRASSNRGSVSRGGAGGGGGGGRGGGGGGGRGGGRR